MAWSLPFLHRRKNGHGACSRAHKHRLDILVWWSPSIGMASSSFVKTKHLARHVCHSYASPWRSDPPLLQVVASVKAIPRALSDCRELFFRSLVCDGVADVPPVATLKGHVQVAVVLLLVRDDCAWLLLLVHDSHVPVVRTCNQHRALFEGNAYEEEKRLVHEY